MDKENRSASNNYNDTLVLELNKLGEIIQFNKGCQIISGYSKNEVLHKKIWDFFIPEAYISQWKEMFNAAIQNAEIKDLKIPLKTCNGKEILISWSSVPLENKEGSIKNICFIGLNLSGNSNGKEMLIKDQDKEKIKDNTKPIKIVVKPENENKNINKKEIEEAPNKTIPTITPVESSDNEEIVEGTPIKSDKAEDIISDLSDTIFI